MFFIGFAKNYTRDCYPMCNTTTRYITEMRNIMWLHCMYYGKPEARDEVVVYPQVALYFEPEDVEAWEGVTSNTSGPKTNLKMTRKNGVLHV